MKVADYKKYVDGKVDSHQFSAQIDRIDKIIQIIELKTEILMPAIERNLKQEIQKKADKSDI